MTSGEPHRNLASSTARMDSVMAVMEAGRGSFGKLMADSTLYDDTRAPMSLDEAVDGGNREGSQKVLQVQRVLTGTLAPQDQAAAHPYLHNA